MKILVRATEKQKLDLLAQFAETKGVKLIESFIQSADTNEADAFIDLMFEDDPSTLHDLKLLLPKTIIINSVIKTLQETNKNFIRINAWEGFLSKSLLEGSFLNEEYKVKSEFLLGFMGKKIHWVPDEPGFISLRIISKIINEASLALKEGVSTIKEIDAAMKLGTSYPFGPFEWAEIIGNEKIQKLLMTLEMNTKKYF